MSIILISSQTNFIYKSLVWMSVKNCRKDFNDTGTIPGPLNGGDLNLVEQRPYKAFDDDAARI